MKTSGLNNRQRWYKKSGKRDWYKNSILDFMHFGCLKIEVILCCLLWYLQRKTASLHIKTQTYLVMLSTAGGEPLHAEAVKGDSEEAVSDHEGEAQPTGRSQQGDLGSQQVGEFVSGAAET